MFPLYKKDTDISWSFTLQKKAEANVCVTQATVKEALDILRGAVMIVYPMNLPPHENVRLELENQEDLTGTQVSLLKLVLQNFNVLKFTISLLCLY